MNTKTLRFKISSLTDEGIVEGHGSTRDNVDLGGDVVKAGAFAMTIKSRTKADGSMEPLPMLWSHDEEDPIGVWESLSEDSRGLACKGRILLDVQRGREIFALMKAGCVKGLSIGYSVVTEKMVGKIRELRELKLFEISPVVFPMNESARVERVKAVESFDDLLEMRSLYSRRRDMFDVLSNCIDDIMWDGDLTADQKPAALDAALAQFHGTAIQWITDIIAFRERMAEGKHAEAAILAKAIAMLGAATPHFASDAHQTRDALLEAEAPKDPAHGQSDEAKAKGAAVTNLDPAKQGQSQDNDAGSDTGTISALRSFAEDLRRPLEAPRS